MTINDSSNPSTGCITGGWNSSGYGGGLYIDASAQLTLNNGTISGNKVEKASGEVKGGCVYVGLESHFTMNGGSITGNSAITSTEALGGGVYIHAYLNSSRNGGTFTMNGGTITGNSIIGNTDRNYSVEGGGVYITSITSSTLGGKFNLSGKCTITGNTANSRGTTEENNVDVSNNSHIDIVGALNASTCIGVTAPVDRIITSGLSGNGSLSNFISDNPAVVLELSSGEVKVVSEYTIVAVTAKAPTCTEPGNSVDCYLKGDKYYRDQACTDEIDPLIPA